MTMLDYGRVTEEALPGNYTIPARATTTELVAGKWEVPDTYRDAVASRQTPAQARRLNSLEAYRMLLAELPEQRREGDSAVLLVELEQHASSIIEAENHLR